MSLSKAKEHLL